MLVFLTNLWNYKMYIMAGLLALYIGVLKVQNVYLDNSNIKLVTENASLVNINNEIGSRLNTIVLESDKLKKENEENIKNFNIKQDTLRKQYDKKIQDILLTKPVIVERNITAKECNDCVGAFQFLLKGDN